MMIVSYDGISSVFRSLKVVLNSTIVDKLTHLLLFKIPTSVPASSLDVRVFASIVG